MAKEDAEVKSGGPGMAASVAIATAIIGAVTTISVAYMNKSDALKSRVTIAKSSITRLRLRPGISLSNNSACRVLQRPLLPI